MRNPHAGGPGAAWGEGLRLKLERKHCGEGWVPLYAVLVSIRVFVHIGPLSDRCMHNMEEFRGNSAMLLQEPCLCSF